MSIHIASLLDKAKVIHSLPSDYKLALVLGVSFSTPANYRTGKTLPDARVISLLCDLTGDDPAILAAEIEAQRAKTPEARTLWLAVAERLALTARHGVAAGVFSVAAGGAILGALPYENAHAETPGAGINENIHCRYLRRRARRCGGFPRLIRRSLRRAVVTVPPFFELHRKGGNHEFSGTKSNAAAVRHAVRSGAPSRRRRCPVARGA